MSESTSNMDDSTNGSAFHSGIIRKTEYFDLFISYKRDNGEDHGQQTAERLYRDLTARGLKVWLDNEQIGFSRDFEVRIEEAILHSKKFACILSPAWLDSENCRLELIKAIGFEKRIVPIHYQNFREYLLEKKEDGTLTENQWRRLDKPQELNFSDPSFYDKALNDLVALCALKDEETKLHTKILCESYYWEKFGKPKGTLLRGIQLTKMTRLKSRCDGEEELPAFIELQNEFLKASAEFVSSEVTRKRTVFLSFKHDLREQATAIDLELRLQNISTWFDDFESVTAEQSDFIEAILNSETIVHLTNSLEEEEDLKLAFARSNDKRILHLTQSQEVYDHHAALGDKSFYLWREGTSMETLVTAIKGDAQYISAHAILLEAAYIWEKSGKTDAKLLPLKEAELQKEWYQLAEAQKSEPKPNIKMIDFIERSIVRGEAVARRKKMAYRTTIIGIVLLVLFGGGAWYFAYKAKESNEELKVSIKNNLQAQKDFSRANKKLQKSKRDFRLKKAEMDSTYKVQDKKLTAQMDVIANLDKGIQQSEALIRATESKLLAKERLITKKEQEMTLMVDTISNLKVEQEKLIAATEKIAHDATLIKFRNIGNEEARQAYQNIRFGLRDQAKKLADSAVAHLTAGGAGTQIQTLYDVYKELVPPAHPLSTVNREYETDLESVLKKNHANSADLIPTIDRNDPTSVEKAKLLAGHKSSEYATHLTSPNNAFVAVGFKDGSVSIYNTSNDTLASSFTNHSHRITSIAFSQNGTYMAIASIDNSFSIVPLNPSNYRQNHSAEIIEQESDTRIETIYFIENHTVITRSALGSRAWGINVQELIKIVRNEH